MWVPLLYTTHITANCHITLRVAKPLKKNNHGNYRINYFGGLLASNQAILNAH
jgi:hypothetical protein